MPRVAVPVINSPYGLHDGHKAVINYAKQFGDVYVNVGDNIRERNRYLETGQDLNVPPTDLTKIQQDCNELNVQIILPDYIHGVEQKRGLAHKRAKDFVDIYEDLLISKFYIKHVVGALTTNFILPPGLERQFDFVVCSAEPIAFFFKKVALLSGMYGERPIFKQIIKDIYGIKVGSSWMNVPFSKQRAREIIDTTRSQYQVGDNPNIVTEINKTLLQNENWKVTQIIVFEGGFVEGHIEDVWFSYPTNPGTAIVNNIDYFE